MSIYRTIGPLVTFSGPLVLSCSVMATYAFFFHHGYFQTSCFVLFDLLLYVHELMSCRDGQLS